MKRFLSLFLAVALSLSMFITPAFAVDTNNNDNSNDVVGEVEEWVYEPSFDSFSTLSADGDSVADTVKVTVTAENKDTGTDELIEGATVRLFVGPEMKTSAKTNSAGEATLSLKGLSIEERLNATISADKVVSLGKAIDGAARDSLFGRYPRDTMDEDGDGDTSEYVRYKMELHSETIDSNGNWIGVPLPKTVESNKVDIAFIIDATGSMSDEIRNVKNNIAAFSQHLIEQGLDIRFSIIEYRDITCGEPTILHRVSGSHWYYDVDSVVSVLGDIYVSGGGDGPETVVDALGVLTDRDMSWRSDAYKFAFVLTDANYKNNNNYGYSNLSEVTDDLEEMDVVTSVIAPTSYRSTYNYLYSTTGGIFANIYASNFGQQMLDLSDSIVESVTREIDLSLSEPRMLVNMSVCYYTHDNSSKDSYRDAVKNMLNEYANRIAETTDGHVLIDNILLFTTHNRLNFYNTKKLASMADIRIEAEEGEKQKDKDNIWRNVQVHSNAHVTGFYRDDTYKAVFDGEDDTEHFSYLKKGEVLDGRSSFFRIQMSGTEGAGWDNSLIDDAYAYSTTLAHETGHYLFGFYDEYLDAQRRSWRDDSIWFKPYPAYGLMDNQHTDIEMSKTAIDYAYTDGDFLGLAEEEHTRHSWLYKESCEDSLADLLTEDNSFVGIFGDSASSSNIDFDNTGAYKGTYTKTLSSDRTAKYSYASLEESDFILFSDDGLKPMALGDTVSSDYFMDMIEDYSAWGSVSVDGSSEEVELSFKPVSGYEYDLYYMTSDEDEYSKADLATSGTKLVAKLPVAEGDLAEVRVVATKDEESVYGTYYIDHTISTENIYLYKSVENNVIAYVEAEEETAYTFVAYNVAYKNGEYMSVNAATAIFTDDGADIESGEIYSVASYVAEIDYSTLSWFTFRGGRWVALDTDVTTDENRNLGARADIDGAGLYVLMAKKAVIGGVEAATDLSFEQSTDRDAVVVLSFEDSNDFSKYYNVYYSDEEFDDKDDEGVVMRTFDATSTDLTINLLERGREVYAGVEIVLEDGSRSELSEIILLGGEADSDGDGIPDWYCDMYNLWGEDGEDKDIANSDDDGDGLTNLEEYEGGSDPTNPNDPVHTTNVAVESVSISEESRKVAVGGTFELTATVVPENASNKEIRWSVEDSSIATITVDDGVCTVKGVRKGTTSVYAVSVDGGYSAECEIKVVLYGDADGDGSLSVRDVTLVLQRIAEWDVDVVDDIIDVDGNSGVTMRDATLILQKIAGWNVVLGR